MNKKAIIFSIAVSLLVILALFVLPSLPKQANADTTPAVNGLYGFAWSSNIGWISFNHTDIPGSTNNYAVNLEPNGDLSGYAWSPSIGWIKFDPGLNGPPGASNRHGAKIEGTTLTGWARACSVVDPAKNTNCDFGPGSSDSNLRNNSSLGGWDGWIEMTDINYDHAAGGLTGYAWGSLNIGWIHLGLHYSSNPGCSLPRIDTDCNSSLDCDPCLQTCAVNCGGTTPSVTCMVTPSTGNKGSTPFTWYVSNLSGFTGDPQNYTYSWSGSDGDGPAGVGTWNTTLARNEAVVSSYSAIGNKTGSVTVNDGNGHTATDNNCSNGVTDGIIVIPACVNNGLPVPPLPDVCCNPDPSDATDGICGPPVTCTITMTSAVNNSILYESDGIYYDNDGHLGRPSIANAAVTLTDCSGQDATFQIYDYETVPQELVSSGVVTGFCQGNDSCSSLSSGITNVGVKFYQEPPMLGAGETTHFFRVVMTLENGAHIDIPLQFSTSIGN
ncbi:MAG: hypothetical protein WC640_02900 [Candidatus Paceibacterota bacterium]|jgi:hypothetical protein